MSSYEVADVVIEPIKVGQEEEINEHTFTEAVGYLVFAVFMVLSVTVILNMLVATMSNTYQAVRDNVDTEWAFGRTEVKLVYLDLPVLPPPFNIIPTTRGIVNLFKSSKTSATRISGKKDVEVGLIGDRKSEEYSILVSILVQRYFSTKGGDTGS